MSRGCAKTIGPKTRIRRCDDESAKCSGSSRLAPPSVFSTCTPPFTTLSIFNAISYRARRSGSSEPRRQTNGGLPSQPRDRAAGVGLVCSPQIKLTATISLLGSLDPSDPAVREQIEAVKKMHFTQESRTQIDVVDGMTRTLQVDSVTFRSLLGG